MPLPGGESRPVWEDPNTPSDGRNEEAKKAFEKIMIVSSVSDY